MVEYKIVRITPEHVEAKHFTILYKGKEIKGAIAIEILLGMAFESLIGE